MSATKKNKNQNQDQELKNVENALSASEVLLKNIKIKSCMCLGVSYC